MNSWHSSDFTPYRNTWMRPEGRREPTQHIQTHPEMWRNSSPQYHTKQASKLSNLKKNKDHKKQRILTCGVHSYMYFKSYGIVWRTDQTLNCYYSLIISILCSNLICALAYSIMTGQTCSRIRISVNDDFNVCFCFSHNFNVKICFSHTQKKGSGNILLNFPFCVLWKTKHYLCFEQIENHRMLLCFVFFSQGWTVPLNCSKGQDFCSDNNSIPCFPSFNWKLKFDTKT